jgi:hypothetical protein
MAPALLDLGWGDGEFDAGKDDDVITTALSPVNLGIPLGAVVWPCDVSATVHHHDDDGSHKYVK